MPYTSCCFQCCCFYCCFFLFFHYFLFQRKLLSVTINTRLFFIELVIITRLEVLNQLTTKDEILVFFFAELAQWGQIPLELYSTFYEQDFLQYFVPEIKPCRLDSRTRNVEAKWRLEVITESLVSRKVAEGKT